MKNSAIKFPSSKLQSLISQPQALRVLKTTENPEIAPIMKFCFAVTDTNWFSTV